MDDFSPLEAKRWTKYYTSYTSDGQDPDDTNDV